MTTLNKLPGPELSGSFCRVYFGGAEISQAILSAGASPPALATCHSFVTCKSCKKLVHTWTGPSASLVLIAIKQWPVPAQGSQTNLAALAANHLYLCRTVMLTVQMY